MTPTTALSSARSSPAPAGPVNKIEQWKQAKHGFDVWPDLLRHAEAATPMKAIDDADLERMKWYGVFYRKRDGEGTYMLRIRLTGCELTAPQAKEIAMIAYEFGYGIIDVTTRANVQVQGLSIDRVPQALERLQAVGLTAKQTGHDNIRNVFCHPLAGLDAEELIDTRELCREITRLFIDSREYADLPRKFNIAVSGAAQHAAAYWSQDLSLLATRDEEGEVVYQVLVGGTQGQNPRLPWALPVVVRSEEAVELTRALLNLFREQGARQKRDQARLRYLIERIGVDGLLDELTARLPFPLRPCVREPQPPAGYDELVGWFRQKQRGLWALGLSIPVGRLSWQQLESLAVAAKRWGSGNLRTTHEQGILLVDIPTGFRDAAATAAAAAGLSPHADSLVRNVVACTGKQFCNIAVTETKGQMLRLVEALRKRGVTLHGIRIHMSGCPSSCAQHHTADIGLKGVRVRRLLGTTEGFDVYLGGGVAGNLHLGLPYKMGVDEQQLPVLVDEVVREYYLRHRVGQTFSAFWREKLKDVAATKTGDAELSPPTWVCDQCDFHHRGEDPPVYCPQCAGLRRNFARLEDAGAAGRDAASADGPAEVPRADGFCFAAQLDRIPAAGGLLVEVAGREIALFRSPGGPGTPEVVAIDNECPHAGGSLAEGTIEGATVTCPLHGWQFDACTGCRVDRADGRGTTAYACLVEAGKVYLKIPVAAK